MYSIQYSQNGEISCSYDGFYKAEIMQEKDQSILTITRCISIVLQIKKQIDKPLSKVTKEDIKTIFQWMNTKRYKVETVEKYKAVI